MGKEILQLLSPANSSLLLTDHYYLTYRFGKLASPLAQLVRLAQLVQQWRDAMRSQNKIENLKHKKL